MIRNRQCLIQINPIKRCLLLLVLFSSVLCSNVYSQCETDPANLMVDLSPTGDYTITIGLATDASLLDVASEYFFIASSFGTINGTEDEITGNCTDTDFNLGAIEVTVEERPLGGGAPTGTCMTTFTINDVTGPGVACLDINAHADNTASDATTTTATFDSDAGDCSAAITFAIPPATDECDGTYTTVISFAAPSSIADITVAYDDTTMPQDVEITFPVGDTEFSITYTDENDNETVCPSYTVTVEDTEDPVYTMCPDPAPASAFQFMADADVAGNCDFTYTSGAMGTDLIPLVDDNCSAILTYELAGATTVAGGAPSSDFLTGVTFNEGVTMVTWSLTDPAGNPTGAPLACMYNVEVVDMTAPVFGTDCSASNFEGVTNTADCTIALTDEDSRAILAPVLGGDHDSDGGTTPDLDPTLADNCEALADIEVIATYIPNDDAPVDANTDGIPDNQVAIVIADMGTTADITALSAAVFPVGTTTVTLTFDDNNDPATDGNISTCTFTVTVTDGVAPTIDGAAALANTVISFNTEDNSCDYTVKSTDTQLVRTATDDCDDTPTITYTIDGNTLTTLVGYTFPLGSTGVMVQAEDDAGNMSDNDPSTTDVAEPVTFTVQVQDMTPPTIGANILPTDDDAITAGVQVILETAADATDCSVTDPADIVPTDFTDNCPGAAVITYNISAGPNGIALTPITDLTGFPFEVTDGTPYSITYTITDAAGNAAPATDAFDLIVLDKTAPIFECETTYEAVLNADGEFEISVEDLVMGSFATGSDLTCRTSGAGSATDPATDNCEARVVYFEYTGAAGEENDCSKYEPTLTFDCEKVGTTEDVTVFVRDFAVDANGDFAPNTTMCTVSVTYVDDTNPEIFCPDDIAMNADAGECEKTITLPIPTIESPFLGTTPNTMFDNSNDGDDPTDADCDLTIEFSIDGGTSFTVLDATSAEQTFPVGTTTVTYRVTDAAGNVSDPTCDFDIVITDTEAPTIDCEEDQTLAADGDCDYNYSGTDLVPLVSDNCPGNLNLTFMAPGATPASGNAIDFINGVVFPIGTTTVTWMVADEATPSPLTAMCEYDVTIEDMAGPSINCDLIQDIAGESNDMDGDGAGPDELTCERILDLDDSEKVLLPVFGRVNSATPPDDNSIPVGLSDNCEALADIEITATYIPNDAAPVDADTDGIPDNQVEVSGIVDETGLVGAIFPVGSTTVTLIFDDNDDPSVVGNTTECTFIVLITDGQKPVINNCPTGTLGRNTTLPECTYTATGGEFDIAAADIVDDCDTNPTVVYTINGTELTTTDGYVFPIGNTLVEVTATDAADNVSDKCSFLVSVSDSTNPTFECPTDDYTFDINQDADGSTCGFVNDFNNDNFVPEAVVNATCSSDEVEFSYMLTDPSSTVTTVSTLDGETFALGTTMVVVTAMVDEDGDDATPLVAVAGNCTFNIIIEDENTAVFECPGDIMVETTLDDTGCGTEVSYVEPTVPGGACNTAPGSTVVRTVGPGPNEFFAVGGSTTVVYELRDDNDVVIDQCSFTVTVVDKTPPSFTCENQTVEVNSTDCEYVIPDATLDPTFVDNCGGTVGASYTLSDADGTVFGSGTGSLATNTLALGVTTVNYTFTDDQTPSNESTCSYTITVVEPATTYTLVADDASTAVVEGDDGTNTTVNFTVTRDNTDCPVSVGYSVEGTGTSEAIPTLDLEDAAGTLTFDIGESQASFSVVIIGDDIVEDDETFNILLASIVGANVSPTPFVYTITNDDSALSVDWLNFTAEATAKNQVNLKWEVANSINTSHYVIERATDGKDFQDLGKIEATTASLYTFTDNLPASGVNYYRVREVETGGRTSISNTINIKVNNTQDITLYPNPTKGTVQLQSSVATDNVEIIVLDALGKIVLEQAVNSDNEINLSTLTPGLYFMQINIDGVNYVRRIVKE